MMQNDEREVRLKEAQRRMSELAVGLRAVFDSPIDVAGVLIAPGVAILEAEFGTKVTATYLESLAQELRKASVENADARLH
ncbi:MAG: hypothetical protein WAW96_20585 [Alphaproteobacteria bacterium]